MNHSLALSFSPFEQRYVLRVTVIWRLIMQSGFEQFCKSAVFNSFSLMCLPYGFLLMVLVYMI